MVIEVIAIQRERQMELHQAQALTQTGRGVVEFTRGVLAALGHAALADEIGTLAAARESAVAALEKADTRGDDIFAAEPVTAEYTSARARLDDVLQRERAAWAKIDAMVAEAREVLAQHDPLGLGQAS